MGKAHRQARGCPPGKGEGRGAPLADDGPGPQADHPNQQRPPLHHLLPHPHHPSGAASAGDRPPIDPSPEAPAAGEWGGPGEGPRPPGPAVLPRDGGGGAGRGGAGAGVMRPDRALRPPWPPRGATWRGGRRRRPQRRGCAAGRGRGGSGPCCRRPRLPPAGPTETGRQAACRAQAVRRRARRWQSAV